MSSPCHAPAPQYTRPRSFDAGPIGNGVYGFSRQRQLEGEFVLLAPSQLTGLAAMNLLEDAANAPLHLAEKVVVDLSDTERVDASGVCVLLRLHGALSGRGRRLKVTAARPHVRDWLKALGLDALLCT